MNYIKKIGAGMRPSADQKDRVLGLTHLRKLFAEFRHPTRKATQEEQEYKLYNMIPLFVKVFGEVHSSEMTEKFGDVLQFCSHLSKLMVTEIRRRASNQSTEAASCAIVTFLEMESSETTGNGWMLLTALNLLSCGNQALIDCMTAASLPSTLVKCLYLFFDLPEIEEPDKCNPNSEFTAEERRILLQKVFVQILVHLCKHTSPAEELARRDDLSLLFSAITSWCPPHNAIWRKCAAEVLMTLSRHGLTQNVVRYIHDKGCLRHCIENMQRIQELSPLELVDMFVTVFCFLKDSSEVSHVLLDDFRSCQGYVFLSEFLLRLEKDDGEESQQALRNLVLLMGTLTTSGHSEIKPSQACSGSLFKMPGFSVPQPVGKGVSVRNIQAFQVLQSVFLKANSSVLCTVILDVINSIYHQDNANYFILEPQHTLSQFSEKIYTKPKDVQEKFFELLEFIIFDLNFVPCKELISISILIKSNQSGSCTDLCFKTLQRILQFHALFKDVFREVGMLEVMVTCLRRYAALFEAGEGQNREPISKEQKEVGCLVMDCLTLLLSSNQSNANVFRECGGARCVHGMVQYEECRQQALNIIQQLILSPQGDDDMATLLGLMHTSPVLSLQLKTHILKALLTVLRESHRSRTVFRKVNGFVYVMSLLLSMEGCLLDPPKAPWDSVERTSVLSILKTVFSTLTVAMRYEPANAKFFETQVQYDSLTEAVRLLGCFSEAVDVQPLFDTNTQDDEVKGKEESLDAEVDQSRAVWEDFFWKSHDNQIDDKTPVLLQSAAIMIKFLYNMVLDTFDRPSACLQVQTDSPALKRLTMVQEEEKSHTASPKRASTGSITFSVNIQCDLIIVHPGAVISILHLLPSVEFEGQLTTSLGLQSYIAELLKGVLYTERNQQIMCDAGMPHQLLTLGYVALADDSHPLHPPFRAMFERLAAQALTPRDLRDFLRLGSPLNCRSVDEMFDSPKMMENSWSQNWPVSRASSIDERRTPIQVENKLKTAGEAVPLTRVKCLVSMTTPKDARINGSAVTPAFVEFDMTTEGFGCLYLPSIAPQGPPTPSVVSGVVGVDSTVIGGIGTGERIFPPQAGMTFSSWFCVDKFSVIADAHPVRLLTIVRNLQGRDENLVCLSVTLSSRERSLIVSTQETHLPSSVTGLEQEPEPVLNDNCVRFWCPELTQEGQWHHLVLIFHRAGIMKNSSVSLYVDSELVSTQKLHYISPNLGGGGTASPTAFTSVYAYIGSPPQLRRNSRLTWRQGPCHLMEDIISSSVISCIYKLGPTYVGSFQSTCIDDIEMSGALVSEEKLVFGVHAHAVSQMTILLIRKNYSKVDSKSIARQLAMSAHDNATPIRIIHNSAGHLNGPARSLGAILIGYLGVRTFCPRPVAKMLENIGGASALLGLVAMASDVEELYAAVKALVCVVKSNKSTLKDMERISGYQLLSMLYKKKQNLLNSHILHLTFSLIGTVDSGRESSVIPNKKAFQDLLCELEVWHHAPFDLQRSLYEHFFELLTDSSEQSSNFQLMRDLGMVGRLLHILKDNQLTPATIKAISSDITVLLQGAPDYAALLKLGQFTVSTLPSMSASEKQIVINGISPTDDTDGDVGTSMYKIKMRNNCLEIILELLQDPSSGNNVVPEEIQKVLGFDWLLLFVQPHVHHSTVITALRVLLTILQNPASLLKFREGTPGGGWLSNTEPVLKQHVGVMLGLNISTKNTGQKRELNQEVCKVPGFTALQWLLPKHSNIPEVYFLMMALLLGQHVNKLPTDVELNIDKVWTVIFGVPASKPVSIAAKEKHADLCPEAAFVILSMIRSMLNQDQEELSGAWIQEYPVTLMQFFLFLYHNQSDFIHLASSPEFISNLAATLFPYNIVDHDVTTPTEEFKPFPDTESFVRVRTPEKDMPSLLTSHPARKFVVDFLRTIVVDSFSQQVSSKSGIILDIVLDASPETATRSQRREYQTEILTVIMEHLLAADVLLGDQAALPLSSGGSYSNMTNNVFYFASRLVDKVWQGVFTRETKEVFEFISKLIAQAKRKSSGVSMDLIYKSLNRTILYQLSRPINIVSSQTTVLESLHKLTSNRTLIFGPKNYDTEFLVCLCYCLLQLTDDDPEKGMENLHGGKALRTTWHLNMDKDEANGDLEANFSHFLKGSGVMEGHHNLVKAAKRVWEELYACKKPALEEIFKTQLNNIDVTHSTSVSSPDINSVRGLIQEYASKVWVTYAESERKCHASYAERLPTQIQSTLQKVGSGVLRLATRKGKKEMPLKVSPCSNVHMTDFISWTLSHISIVKDLVELQYQQYLKAQEHMERYLLEEWTQREVDLLRERGLWGPTVGSRLRKWMLDMTEGPSRMLKKMIPNDWFYAHYPYRPDMENSPLKYKIAMSYDSKEYFERFRSQTLVEPDVLPIMRGVEDTSETESVDEKIPDDITRMTKLLGRPSKQRQVDVDEESEDPSCVENLTEMEKENQGEELRGEEGREGPTESSGTKTDNNQTILRILGEGEKITNIFRCARIQGLDTAEGLLLFGREHFYVIDGFTMLRTREIRDIDSLPPDLHDPIIPKASKGSGTQKRLCSKFAYEDIREVHKRRYLLQPIAVEVFSADGRNYLLSFPRKLRNKVFAKFMSVATAMTDSALQSVSGQKQGAKIEAGSGIISSLMGEKSVTQRWERGEINNFQYLMHLNTLAGRSYNDLMQYPVFPWIVGDYDSEELDLYDEKTFRDLSKPMGAQTPGRLQQFKKRYQDWDDPQGETPPYHYGTHYSSAMIVASYLVRMEPFTQHFLSLQGGHFDLADRMFHSIRENWYSAAKNNMADVKELIPEFFYLPEFLRNSNNFDLGVKQSGVALHDVVLPPWAKGDPREFIRAHREALESDFVSAHLHEWIDLIFGYKQQGPAAVEAVNVFHHLFYEGNVDIYSIDDPLKKNATIGFINNFGQIPKQLFKKPHPQKKLALRLNEALPMGVVPSQDRLFFHNVDNLRPAKQAIKDHMLYMKVKSAVGQILVTDRVVMAVEQNKVIIPNTYQKYLSWGFSDRSVRIGTYDSEKVSQVFECLDNGEILCATCPNARTYITGGTSCVVNVWESRQKRLTLKQPLYGHIEAVTCLASCQGYNMVVSGSRDKTCIIWDLSRLQFVRQLRGHSGPVAAVCINELTGDIASCSGTYLYLWSINGEEIACVNTAPPQNNQQILCLAMSQMYEWDSKNVILTGSKDGVVRMWSVEYVQVPKEEKKNLKVEEKSPTEKQKSPNQHDAFKDIQTAADRLKALKDLKMESKDVELSSSVDSESHMGLHAPTHAAMLEHEDSIVSSVSNATPQNDDAVSVDSEDQLSVKSSDPSLETALEAEEYLSNSSTDFVKGGLSDRSQSQPDFKDTLKEADIMVKSVSTDFEVISDSEVQGTPKTMEDLLKKYKGNPRNYLREGFKWQRQLMFRSKLTMHTAFERDDNKEPAVITAIAVSKDHRTVYVGEDKGRVYSWTVTDQPGRVVADHWIKDDGVEKCHSCSVRFSFSERKHHCRNCGKVFCSRCSRYETEIRRLRILKPVRVCQACYNILRAQQAADAVSQNKI
ncbi:WD repeat and FYVE domain-containing protein 3-like isoform X2 [Saccostrea echinata]|uniref:WD repeat and FYVE domain-containing protein 3-like isoform X2 n=1 Tax=Saccostrea echinata TaxID=191078 RepID=UPI002A82C2B1|nr:WD repeat and FYVE domain-containing protein 3-like isoform X2 [Saccostrea echinata]